MTPKKSKIFEAVLNSYLHITFAAGHGREEQEGTGAKLFKMQDYNKGK